jgi:hypothetical protein
LVAVTLGLPAAAEATPPTIIGVDPADGYIELTWDLPLGMHSWAVDTARSPDVASDGSFLLANIVFSERVEQPTDTYLLSLNRLAAGTYWVHVSAYGSCDSPDAPSCTKEFSAARQIVVSPAFPTLGPLVLSGRHVTANWSKASFLVTDYVEIATSPDVYADGPYAGAFIDENLVVFSSPPGNSTSWTSPSALPAGTYYLHVAVFDPLDCADCFELFTEIRSITVPAAAPTLLSVDEVQRYLRATWEMPSGVENDFVEVATSPEVYVAGPAKGAFLDEHTVLVDDANALPLPNGRWAYQSDSPLKPGTYYVHVAGISGCTTGVPDAQCFDDYSQTLSVTIPGSPQPGPGALPAPASSPHKVTAFASLFVGSSQDVDKLTVKAAIREGGVISAAGHINVPTPKREFNKVFAIDTVSAAAKPGAVVKLRLKVNKKALRAVKRAFRRHRPATAKITITAKDAAGNLATGKRSVKLRR